MIKRMSMTVVASAVAVGSLMGLAAPAQAATCYGTDCTGMDPSRTSCAADAKTIGRMDINGDGILELRWSRSCNASWGRFSTYWRMDLANGEKTGISHARVTAWNPGSKSQRVAGQVLGIGSTWWTAMVTGTTRSCTGVELVAMNAGGSQGWFWGPCAD